METAETGKRAFLGPEVLDGCAYLGGDGLFLDEEEVGFDELGLLGLLVFGEERGVDFVGDGMLGLESCSGGSLDDSEGGHDIAVGVGDLFNDTSVSLAGCWLGCCQTTYHGKQGEIEDNRGKNEHASPWRELEDMFFFIIACVVLLGDFYSAADKFATH